MRYWAIALVPQWTADVQAMVARLMEPYNQALIAPPYKKYLSEQATKGHTARLGVTPGDFETLAARLNAHYAATMDLTTHFQSDALGIFVWAALNPNGKYTRWSLNSLTDDVWPVSALPRDLLRDLAPHAVITPDGHWHELFPNIWGAIPTAQDKLRIVREAYGLIDLYPDHLAVRLECHV
ncbi:MAG TPA: hypothetical protein VF739_15535 [Ktedonobacterales bacterium]